MTTTYTPTGLVRHGSFTLPSDGEPAVVSSVNIAAGFEYLGDNTAWSLLQWASAYNILNYGADPTGAVDATTAIQDAINDASAAGGGTVLIAPGSYQYSGLLLPDRVSLRGVPNASFLVLNHATNDAITCGGSSTGVPTVVSDIRFLASVVNTGTGVLNAAGQQVIFNRCAWNGSDAANSASNNLQGKIATVNAVGCELTFLECRIDVVGSLKALHASNGKIRMVRGNMSVPAAYAESFAFADSGEITLDGIRADLTAHSSGAMTVLYANSSSIQLASMLDCLIDATGASGTIDAFTWSSGATIVALGNVLAGNVNRYGLSNQPASGSTVEFFGITTASGIAAVTVFIGAGTYVYRGSSTVPTFTFPTGAEKYQRLRLIIKNASGSDWGAFGLVNAISIPSIPALVNGQIVLADFQFIDVVTPGTFGWVLLDV